MNHPPRASSPESPPPGCAGPGGHAGFQATTAGSCYTCAYRGRPFGLGLWCERPLGRQICALPQRGCAFWMRRPEGLDT